MPRYLLRCNIDLLTSNSESSKTKNTVRDCSAVNDIPIRTHPCNVALRFKAFRFQPKKVIFSNQILITDRLVKGVDKLAKIIKNTLPFLQFNEFLSEITFHERIVRKIHA